MSKPYSLFQKRWTNWLFLLSVFWIAIDYAFTEHPLLIQLTSEIRQKTEDSAMSYWINRGFLLLGMALLLIYCFITAKQWREDWLNKRQSRDNP